MTTKFEFLSINLLFRTDAKYDEVARYLRDGRPAAKGAAFARKYAPYELRGSKIFHADGNIEIVRKRDISALLARLWSDKTIGLGKGVQGLYKYVQMHFGNVTRADVEAFCRGEPDYVISQPRPHRVNKPFVAKRVGELFALDLIDMNPYLHQQRLLGQRYILTVIDVFSRRVFLGMLKEKSAKMATAAFKSILTRAEVVPTRVLTDNGTEFQGVFDEFLESKGIRHSNARPHQPQSNGLVERANQTVRNVMKGVFVKSKSLNWSTELRTIENNINEAYHSAIKTSPNALWNARDNEEPDKVTERAIEHVKESNAAKLAKFADTQFAVGDHVRVLMSSLFSGVRAKVKAGDRKAVVVQFDPTIYVVSKVIRPRDGGLGRNRYQVSDLQGNVLRIGRAEKVFYASELAKADPDKLSDMTQDEALRLDGVRRVPDNDVYIYGDGLYFDEI